MVTVPQRPRVWLAAGLGGTTLPPTESDRPQVRDDQGRVWIPGTDGLWHTADRRHHQTWQQLHARSDLCEVPGETTELVVAA